MVDDMKAHNLAQANLPSIVHRNGEGQFVTDTLTIAVLVESQHKNVLELVRNYLVDFQEFGGVAFETRSFETAGGTQQREIAILNEDQAYLLLTYMRNTAVVRNAKKALVRAFKVAREAVSIHSDNFIRIEKALAESMEISARINNGLIETQSELRRSIVEVKSEVTEVRGNVASLEAKIIDFGERIAKRKEFPAATRHEYRLTVLKRYQCQCPCCQATTILDKNGQAIPDIAHYEHWNGKQSNRPSDGWLVCRKCNIELEASRHHKRTAFERFQQLREEVCQPQSQLSLFEHKRNA